MHPDFRLPTLTSIDGRSSSITAAFFKALTPVIEPSENEVDEALAILGMSRGKCFCAYCGGRRTEWDHFRPIVVAKRPTGYITEIANLVPSCGPCNQSKGARRWKTWITGTTAKGSPTKRSIPDLAGRIARLETFEHWREPLCVDYERIIGPHRWQSFINRLDAIIGLLKEAQKDAVLLRGMVEHSMVQMAAQIKDELQAQIQR